MVGRVVYAWAQWRPRRRIRAAPTRAVPGRGAAWRQQSLTTTGAARRAAKGPAGAALPSFPAGPPAHVGQDSHATRVRAAGQAWAKDAHSARAGGPAPPTPTHPARRIPRTRWRAQSTHRACVRGAAHLARRIPHTPRRPAPRACRRPPPWPRRAPRPAATPAVPPSLAAPCCPPARRWGGEGGGGVTRGSVEGNRLGWLQAGMQAVAVASRRTQHAAARDQLRCQPADLPWRAHRLPRPPPKEHTHTHRAANRAPLAPLTFLATRSRTPARTAAPGCRVSGGAWYGGVKEGPGSTDQAGQAPRLAGRSGQG